MAKSEIKLRKDTLDDAMLKRYQNYPELLRQHQRQRRKRTGKRFIIYSFVIAVIIVLLLTVVSYWLVRLERQREKSKPQKISWHSGVTFSPSPNSIVALIP